MAENNEKGYELYRVFLSAHAVSLKYEHERDETEGRLQGFISGLWFADFIDVACYKSLRDYNRRVVKSIIRHYKKINKMREHEQKVKDLVLKEYTQFKGMYNERGMRTLLIGYVHGLTELGLYMFDPEEVTRYISHLVEREGK